MTLSKKEDDVLKLIITDSFSKDRSYYNYFFNKNNHIKWFYPLLENNVFDPESISFDYINMDGNKKIKRSQFWVVLLYLEKISMKNDDRAIFINIKC